MTNTTTLPLAEQVKARIANLEELLDTYTDVVLRKAVTAKIQENRDFLSMIDKTAKELKDLGFLACPLASGSIYAAEEVVLKSDALALLISQKKEA